MIDECQIASKLWERYSVAKTDGYGLYILTGSTIVDIYNAIYITWPIYTLDCSKLDITIR